MPSLSEITPYITASFSCAAVAEFRETPKEKILATIANTREYVAFLKMQIVFREFFFTTSNSPFLMKFRILTTVDSDAHTEVKSAAEAEKVEANNNPRPIFRQESSR